jgi:hypothetical protein
VQWQAAAAGHVSGKLPSLGGADDSDAEVRDVYDQCVLVYNNAGSLKFLLVSWMKWVVVNV